MKKYKTAMCALALTLCCVPLAACNHTAEEEPLETGTATYEPFVPQVEEPPVSEAPVAEPIDEPKPLRAEYVYIHTDGLNVRKGAGTSYTSLGKVESGILMQYVGKTGGWYETRYKNQTAYVSADARYATVATLDMGSEEVESVIAEGLQMIGVPYVYGAVRLHDGKGNLLKGFTVTQFDCSSLMQYMFYKGAGVLLNTTTRTQVSQGKEVKKSDIRRGDLLFFTNASRKNNTGIERVGHVALYLGDNYILHTASDYAKIEQISTTRWSYFITARRVL